MEDGLVWSTTRVRDSLRLIIIGVSGGAEGGIEVVMRHPPVQQASLQALNSLITPGEFEGVRAVVLGGTRGLGLLAARALVAGGAEVVVTGRPSGDPVDGLRCEWMDVAHPDPIILRRLHALAPTHLLHFATPPIPRRTGRAWSHELYESYIAVYEGGLALASRLASSSLRVFYPSTAFIEERPSGFDEYIAAKEASERAARDLARNSEGIAVMVERLPVLATDQTAGVANVSPEFNLEVMLPILRSFAGSTG
jgi:nucleoside-diphosphate-sugar epimerase